MQDSKLIYAKWYSNMYFMGMGSIQGFGRIGLWWEESKEPHSWPPVCFSFLPQLELSSSSEQMTNFDFIIYFKILFRENISKIKGKL